MAKDKFEKELKDQEKFMIEDIESLSIDDLKSNGITLVIGGKNYIFKGVEIVSDFSTEKKVRNEYKEKIKTQQDVIREKINSRINQILVMWKNKQKEMERKENDLKTKYSKAAMMPDLKENHYTQGLSVIKGRNNDELEWMYRAVYAPKFMKVYNNDGSGKHQRKMLSQPHQTKLKTNILIVIRTKGNNVSSIVTKKDNNNGLIKFSHYHQMTDSDCWGSWKGSSSKWETPDDILKLAKYAEGMLETINQGSIGRRHPTGFPMLSTLEKSLKNPPKSLKDNSDDINEDDDMWSSV